MHALIQSGRVIEVATEPFEVHEDLIWVVCDETVAPGWTYEVTSFDPPLPPPAPNLAAMAATALDASDRTILRCFEYAVAVPSAWLQYRAALRAIIFAPATATELPARPAYPEGT